MSSYGFSDIECKIILENIKKRAKFRQEFLKLRTDPFKHAEQAGYVFDPALQRYLSLKACQYDYFSANPRTSIFGFAVLVLPMLLYGSVIYKSRQKLECDYRCGRIKYRDRRYKFA